MPIVLPREEDLATAMAAEIPDRKPGGDQGVVQPQRDPTFYSDHVVFQAENFLYKVPKRMFEKGETFRDMFARTAASSIDEGTCDEHPFVLGAVTAQDFRCFLRIMFRPCHDASSDEQKVLSLQEWESVLKLATMWGFDGLRQVAIRHLEPLLRDSETLATRWVVLARQYNVTGWSLSSLVALACRTQSLQLQEVDTLGIQTIIKMAEVREARRRISKTIRINDAIYETEIRRIFADEFSKKICDDSNSD